MVVELFHAFILGTSLVASIVLAIVVLTKKFKSMASFYYFFFMLAVTAHVAGDLFFQLSTNIRDALFWINLYWIGFYFLAILFFYFTTVFPKRDKVLFQTEFAKSILLIIPLGLTYALLFSTDFITQLFVSSTGLNSVVYGSLYIISPIYLAIFMWVGLIKLYLDYRGATFESEKKMIRLIFIGIFFPAFFGILGDTFALRMLGFGELKLASVFILISCIIMSYVVIKHKIFSITPISETPTETKPIQIFENGKAYFINERSVVNKKAFRLFSDQVRHGRQGLIVSTMDPNEIRKKYHIPKTPIICLTNNIESKNNIKIEEIEMLNNTIDSFLNRAKNPAVLLDGITEIITLNGSKKVSEFFNALIKKALETNATLLFSIKKEEDEFIETFNKIRLIKSNLNTLKKRFFSHEIAEETYNELASETELELLRTSAELKIVEEELIGQLVNPSKHERKKVVLEKTIVLINYAISKRKISQEDGGEMLKVLQKELFNFEKENNTKNNINKFN